MKALLAPILDLIKFGIEKGLLVLLGIKHAQQQRAEENADVQAAMLEVRRARSRGELSDSLRDGSF